MHVRNAVDKPTRRGRILRALGTAGACLLVITSAPANASETDQFLAMDVKLDDSARALNRFLNTEAIKFLAEENARPNPVESPERLTEKYYFYLFKGLYASRLRSWLHTSDKVDRYPDNSVGYFKHLRMSIFGVSSFPFILPMSRTIRVGDVHFGIDKMGHFWGFGRRYFTRYLRLREQGLTEEEAMQKVVMRGFLVERYFVGNVVDGIFSYADLEANFQGMMLARALCDEEDPYFKRLDDTWILARPIDIQPYITPGFDESYNPCHYIGRRKKHVFKVLRRDYCDTFNLPIVQERFARYDTYPRSFSQKVIDQFYAKRGKDPRELQSIEVICGCSE